MHRAIAARQRKLSRIPSDGLSSTDPKASLGDVNTSKNSCVQLRTVQESTVEHTPRYKTLVYCIRSGFADGFLETGFATGGAHKSTRPPIDGAVHPSRVFLSAKLDMLFELADTRARVTP